MNRNAAILSRTFSFALQLSLIGLLSFSFADTFQTTGTLKGEVGLLEGNCMPSPNSPPCKPKAVEATIYVTQPSEKFDLSSLVDSVKSGKNGAFEMTLSPGNYSVFTKYESEVSCAVFQCTPECICNPISIAQDSTTVLKLKINKASW